MYVVMIYVVACVWFIFKEFIYIRCGAESMFKCSLKIGGASRQFLPAIYEKESNYVELYGFIVSFIYVLCLNAY